MIKELKIIENKKRVKKTKPLLEERIKRTIRIRTNGDLVKEELLRKSARLFAEVFSGAPYFDPWTEEKAFELVFKDLLTKKGAILALVEEKTEIAVAGGFSISEFIKENIDNKELVKKIRKEIDNRGLNEEEVFYLDFVAVKESHRNQGIGSAMTTIRETIAKINGFKAIVFRTATKERIRLAKKEGFEKMFEDDQSGRKEVKGKLTMRIYFIKRLE